MQTEILHITPWDLAEVSWFVDCLKMLQEGSPPLKRGCTEELSSPTSSPPHSPNNDATELQPRRPIRRVRQKISYSSIVSLNEEIVESEVESEELELEDTTSDKNHGDEWMSESDTCAKPATRKRNAKSNLKTHGGNPAWEKQEDKKLCRIKHDHPTWSWAEIAVQLGTNRSSSQCYQRWNRVLNPSIKKGSWTEKEIKCLTTMVKKMKGDTISWSEVAKFVPGRTGKLC
eukprot:TRINITY_DN3232_c0_g1_i3.p1 TRINITY_DN3232_c0_g1~~TRINITY_DN3232_c0_g1_i3.p1  ORF type:complete len:230 (+),score=23.97 TRINITY_DN3232_c0_g1_i3:53-742(+)